MVAAIAVAFAAAGPAAADRLVVTAQGNVASSCSIAKASDFGAVNLAAGGSTQATATVNCNTGFRINAQSTNGALKSGTTAAASFVNSNSYTLAVSVPVESGAPAAASCGSATLLAGQAGCALSPANTTGLSSGGRPAIGRTATLTLSWTPPTLPARLMAGQYSDTITVTIATVP